MANAADRAKAADWAQRLAVIETWHTGPRQLKLGALRKEVQEFADLLDEELVVTPPTG